MRLWILRDVANYRHSPGGAAKLRFRGRSLVSPIALFMNSVRQHSAATTISICSIDILRRNSSDFRGFNTVFYDDHNSDTFGLHSRGIVINIYMLALCSRAGQYIFPCALFFFLLLIAALCSRCRHYIFALWFLSFYLSFLFLA